MSQLPFEPSPADQMLTVLQEHDQHFSPKNGWLGTLATAYPSVDLVQEAYALVDWMARRKKHTVSVARVKAWLTRATVRSPQDSLRLDAIDVETGEVLEPHERPKGGFIVQRGGPRLGDAGYEEWRRGPGGAV